MREAAGEGEESRTHARSGEERVHRVTDPHPRRALAAKYIIYMGRDKHENEALIKWGLPTDMWFHVSNLSSAHVYLRLPRGTGPADIPADVLVDCCQLVKANSIEGSKQNNVRIVYTMWDNLKKTGDMEVGQVGYHNERAQHYAVVEKKESAIVNRINRTRVEKPTDIVRHMREKYEKTLRREKRERAQAEAEAAAAAKEARQREREAASYDSIMREDDMVTNAEMKMASAEEFEDDFM